MRLSEGSLTATYIQGKPVDTAKTVVWTPLPYFGHMANNRCFFYMMCFCACPLAAGPTKLPRVKTKRPTSQLPRRVEVAPISKQLLCNDALRTILQMLLEVSNSRALQRSAKAVVHTDKSPDGPPHL